MQSKKSKVSSKLWAALAAAGIIAGAGTMAYQFSYAETAPQVEMNHKVVPLFNNPPAARIVPPARLTSGALTAPLPSIRPVLWTVPAPPTKPWLSEIAPELV